jgi:hypothetical protein
MTDRDAQADDRSIPDCTELWRRIPHRHWVPDDSVPNGWRLSSAAFDDYEMSVVIADECTGGLSTLLHNHERFGVASFTVGQVRAHGWGVVRAPDDELPGHAHVMGKKSHGKRAALAKSCRMLRHPEPG